MEFRSGSDDRASAHETMSIIELHGDRTPDGVAAPAAQRMLALTAAIQDDRLIAVPVTRSVIVDDH